MIFFVFFDVAVYLRRLWITNSYRADRSVSLSTTLSDPDMGQFWIGVPSLRKLVPFDYTRMLKRDLFAVANLILICESCKSEI